MAQQDQSFLLLILLIIQTIFIFLKTSTTIIFDEHLFNLDELYFKFINQKYIDSFLLIFIIIQAFLSATILYRKKSHTDILTFILVYLIFSYFLHFYYYYLVWKKENPELQEKIHKYQDINTILLFFITGYGLYYIFNPFSY